MKEYSLNHYSVILMPSILIAFKRPTLLNHLRYYSKHLKVKHWFNYIFDLIWWTTCLQLVFTPYDDRQTYQRLWH